LSPVDIFGLATVRLTNSVVSKQRPELFHPSLDDDQSPLDTSALKYRALLKGPRHMKAVSASSVSVLIRD